MEMTKAERRQIFWNIGLNGYEKKTLKEAGFILPEQLLSLPLIYLVHLEGFGFPCTIDVLQALCEYLELPEENFDETIDDLFEDYYKAMNEDDDYYYDDDITLDDETEFLIGVDEILYGLGYTDDKKISQITVRELLNIEGIGPESISSLGDEIIRTYYRTYSVPTYKFKSRDDLKLNGKLFFQNLR